eukprot:COSAG04_NODE_368_length_15757_cov_6.049176_10_plen_228_part_00
MRGTRGGVVRLVACRAAGFQGEFGAVDRGCMGGEDAAWGALLPVAIVEAAGGVVDVNSMLASVSVPAAVAAAEATARPTPQRSVLLPTTPVRPSRQTPRRPGCSRTARSTKCWPSTSTQRSPSGSPAPDPAAPWWHSAGCGRLARRRRRGGGQMSRAVPQALAQRRHPSAGLGRSPTSSPTRAPRRTETSARGGRARRRRARPLGSPSRRGRARRSARGGVLAAAPR